MNGHGNLIFADHMRAVMRAAGTGLRTIVTATDLCAADVTPETQQQIDRGGDDADERHRSLPIDVRHEVTLV